SGAGGLGPHAAAFGVARGGMSPSEITLADALKYATRASHQGPGLWLSHAATHGDTPMLVIHSRVRPSTGKSRLLNSLGRETPARKIAVRSSAAKISSHSSTASSPVRPRSSSGRPTPTATAPRARALAASRPLRTPPVAIVGSTGAHSITLTVVGTPHSA